MTSTYEKRKARGVCPGCGAKKKRSRWACDRCRAARKRRRDKRKATARRAVAGTEWPFRLHLAGSGAVLELKWAEGQPLA